MRLKTTITLMLGLVFQLAQVLPGAVGGAAPCHAAAASCHCCMGARSCDCAKNSESQNKPTPAPLQAGSVVKLPAAQSTETMVSAEPLAEARPCGTAGVFAHAGLPVAYAGVRVSVAFCSFVI